MAEQLQEGERFWLQGAGYWWGRLQSSERILAGKGKLEREKQAERTRVLLGKRSGEEGGFLPGVWLERGEIHIQRHFFCLRVKFLLLEEYSESGASLGEKACW